MYLYRSDQKLYAVTFGLLTGIFLTTTSLAKSAKIIFSFKIVCLLFIDLKNYQIGFERVWGIPR